NFLACYLRIHKLCLGFENGHLRCSLQLSHKVELASDPFFREKQLSPRRHRQILASESHLQGFRHQLACCSQLAAALVEIKVIKGQLRPVPKQISFCLGENKFSCGNTRQLQLSAGL